jgi:hypothetical protein
MKRALLHYHDLLADSPIDSGWAEKFPVFVVVQSSGSPDVVDPELPIFARATPDLTSYYVSFDGGPVVAKDFGGTPAGPSNISPVVVLKSGNTIDVCPAVAGKPVAIDFVSEARPTDVGAFDPATRSFVAVPVNAIISLDTQYAAGVGAWQEYFGSIYNPSIGPDGLRKVVKSSRESAVLVGSTSYIVVENSAQWKMLERKQNQKMRNVSVLEFQEAAVPEPSTWCLIIFGGGMLLILAMRRGGTLNR